MLRTFRSYPEWVVAVPEPIRGTTFFPGGLGLISEGMPRPSTAPPAEIMVVGQDFNTLRTYEITRERGSEFATSRTWLNMRKVFPQLGLPIRQCFFTSYYVGLREQGRETGPFPGSRDRDFVQRCARFFERQLEILRPSVIVSLGLAPLQVIGGEVFQFDVPPNMAQCVDVHSNHAAAHGEVVLIALTHPSLYFANVKKRRFLGQQGLDAETALVRRAIQQDVPSSRLPQDEVAG